MIISLDPSSTAVGFCLHDGKSVREAGVIRPDTRKEPCPCRRAFQMGREVLGLIEEHAEGLACVLIEIPPPTQGKRRANPSAQHQAFGLLMGVLLRHGIEIHKIHPATWTRNRPKEVWSADIRARHKIPETTDKGADACAAIGIAEWWLSVGRHREAGSLSRACSARA